MMPRHAFLQAVMVAVVMCEPATSGQDVFSTSATSALAQAATSGFDEAETLRACLTEPSDDPSTRDISAEPIKAMFIDGQTKPVDMLLCVASSIEWHRWYLLDRRAPDFSDAYIDFGDDTRPLADVRALRASPDGKYLAVQYSAEGHSSVEVVDLPALVKDSTYEPLSDAIDSYPGSVWIRSWNGRALEVESDVLLSHPTDGRTHLPLRSDEMFSWDFVSGRIVPLREALQNPVQYFASVLLAASRDARDDVRAEASSNLGRLEDPSAISILEQALALENGPTTLDAIQDALDRLNGVAGALKRCLVENRDALRAERIIVEPIEALFVDGQPRPTEQMLCLVDDSGDRPRSSQSWFRLNRSSNASSRRIPSGNGDRVAAVRASPDGRYLAIRYLRTYEESVSYVEIVELPALILDNVYRPAYAIHGYPGSVSINGWNGGVLAVTSDRLLNHQPNSGRRNDEDAGQLPPLLSEEAFAWDDESRTVVPVRDVLLDPIHYYCDGLAAASSETRLIAALGLGLLGDRSATVCLQRALAAESNEAVRAELHAALSRSSR